MLNSFNNCKYSSLNVSVLWCRSRFLIIPVIYLYSSSFHSFLTRLCLFCTARPFGYVFVYKCLPRLTLYIAYLKARWLISLFLATNILSPKGRHTISPMVYLKCLPVFVPAEACSTVSFLRYSSYCYGS